MIPRVKKCSKQMEMRPIHEQNATNYYRQLADVRVEKLSRILWNSVLFTVENATIYHRNYATFRVKNLVK